MLKVCRTCLYLVPYFNVVFCPRQLYTVCTFGPVWFGRPLSISIVFKAAKLLQCPSNAPSLLVNIPPDMSESLSRSSFEASHIPVCFLFFCYFFPFYILDSGSDGFQPQRNPPCKVRSFLVLTFVASISFGQVI